MTENLWIKKNGAKYICSLEHNAWRIVEAQEITATRKLVDSLDEQEVLEELIESSKPFFTREYADFHPLLYTAFRYRPLKHGSRFGKYVESSLWYGSVELKTAMAEVAYYRFNFLRASVADFGMVELPLTAYAAQIKTERGAKLAEQPFTKEIGLISSPVSYQTSQELGRSMRHAQVEAFSYQSARDPHHGMNVALFTPKAFLRKNPDAKSFQSWQCIANPRKIEFIRSSAVTRESMHFPLETFLVDGELPFPAA